MGALCVLSSGIGVINYFPKKGQCFCLLPGGFEPLGSIACRVVGVESIQGELKCFCVKDGTRRMRLLEGGGLFESVFIGGVEVSEDGIAEGGRH
jgi:hypothetical protein